MPKIWQNERYCDKTAGALNEYKHTGYDNNYTINPAISF
jgi:hypothetical protein